MQNLHLFVPFISKLLNRDVAPDINMLLRGRDAVGSCLNKEGQVFISTNWYKLVEFMETKEGKEAITALLDAWVISMVPTAITNNESEPVVVESKLHKIE